MTQGYAGEVRQDESNHLMLPAAWRIDNYFDEEEDESLEALANHRLVFVQDTARRDAMARDDDDTLEARFHNIHRTRIVI